MCIPLIKNAKIHIDLADKTFKHLEEMYTAVQVKGRGYHSTAQLEKSKAACEKVYKLDKEIEIAVKALKPLMAISPVLHKP